MSAADRSNAELLASLCDETISPAEMARLDRLLCTDAAARRLYLEYLAIHARLSCQFRPPLELQESEVGDQSEVRGQRSEVRDQESEVGAAVELPHQLLPHQPGESPAPPSEPLMPPIIIDTSGPWDVPRLSLHSPLGGWLFSYAAATVITGMAILGAWVYKVSHDYALPDKVAVNNNSREPTAPGDGSPGTVGPRRPELVGLITGRADCRWVDPQDAPSAAVPLGRTYALASGLVEISYQSGAKVILQGPCTYEVDSSAGGFLALGKLTARMQTKGEGGRGKAEETDNQKSEVNDQESPFPLPPSAFVVRTPTAVVTDLGTEFGVEVDRSGATRSHVFRGRVELRALGGGNGMGQVIPLTENQSASVEAGRDGVVRAVRATGHGAAPLATAFVRAMPGTLIYNFDDGATHGWAPLAEYPGDKRQAYYVVSLRDVDLPGLVDGAQSGAFCVLTMTASTDPRYEYDFTNAARGAQHATCTFASPRFRLNPAGHLSDLTFWLNGTGNGADAGDTTLNGVMPPGTTISSLSRNTVPHGFLGVVLLDATTGNIVLAGSADGTLSYRRWKDPEADWHPPKKGGFGRLGEGWWQLRFTMAQLAKLGQNDVYQLVLVDNSSNAWVALDTVAIPGYLVDPGAVPHQEPYGKGVNP